MHVANPWKSYQQTATLTAPPGQIVLMLYDGALRSLARALPGFSCADPGKANMTIHNNIKKAQEIIRELNGALNMEQGGDCAATLRRLYDYFDRRLWESNLRKRREGVDEVVGHLNELRNAWATMLQQRGSASSPAPATPASLASV